MSKFTVTLREMFGFPEKKVKKAQRPPTVGPKGNAGDSGADTSVFNSPAKGLAAHRLISELDRFSRDRYGIPYAENEELVKDVIVRQFADSSRGRLALKAYRAASLRPNPWQRTII